MNSKIILLSLSLCLLLPTAAHCLSPNEKKAVVFGATILAGGIMWYNWPSQVPTQSAKPVSLAEPDVDTSQESASTESNKKKTLEADATKKFEKQEKENRQNTKKRQKTSEQRRAAQKVQEDRERKEENERENFLFIMR